MVVRWTIQWRTKELRYIRRIQERFGMQPKMSVNYRSPIDIDPESEDYQLLLDIERRGWIRIERGYMKDLM
jgi:hypothetical protein